MLDECSCFICKKQRGEDKLEDLFVPFIHTNNSDHICSFKEYVGFTERYFFCEGCNTKKESI